jgi:hypothetical protein
MKFRIITSLTITILLLQFQAIADNDLYNDNNYSIKIAVNINEDHRILGKLEYSNQKPQYPLQLVIFNCIGEEIFTEPYVFELLEKVVIEPKLHQIKCRTLNDKYGGNILLGSIDFRDWTKPKIKLVTETGHTYISNISAKGKSLRSEIIPNVWLGN